MSAFACKRGGKIKTVCKLQLLMSVATCRKLRPILYNMLTEYLII